jgi:hypothetical protein
VLNNVDHPIGHQRASRIRNPGVDQPALFSQHKRATASRSWFGSTPPFDQFSFQRNERPQYRPSEQGDVLRKQQGAEREHPESQHRKKTENSEDDQQQSDRNQRDDDPLSQRRKPPAPLGSSRDIRSISRSSRSASRSRIAALFYRIAVRAKPGRSSEHRDDRLGQFDQILLLQIE